MNNNITKLDNNNFEQEVLNYNDLPVLVYLYVRDFGCAIINSYLDEIANDYKDRLKICKFFIDSEENIIIDKLKLTNISTLKIFKNGKEVLSENRSLNKKDKLIKLIDKYLENEKNI